MRRFTFILLFVIFLCLSVSAQTPRLVFGRPEKISVEIPNSTVQAASIETNGPISIPEDKSKTTETNEDNDFLVSRKSFVLSYNHSRGSANWVNWHVQASDIGKIRKDAFHADPLLPVAWRIPSTAYSGTPYQRGHMCNSKDRSTTLAKNNETFVMSNMQPQLPELNMGTWKKLEMETRRLILQGQQAYIWAGCYGGDKGIFNGKITVPSKCYKIIVLLPARAKGLAGVNANTKVIAVIMPNIVSINPDWKVYVKTVDLIEQETGYNFLSKLPDQIENILEAKPYRP